VRHAAIKLGFNIDMPGAVMKMGKQTCTFKCSIGSSAWQKRHDAKQPEGVPKFNKCPFSVWYERSFDEKTGEGTSDF